MSFGEVMYYAIVVALVFGVGFLLMALKQFLSMWALKGDKYVDGGKGKILDYMYDMGDEYTPACLAFLVECYVNGIYYKQYTENIVAMKMSTLRIRRGLKARVGKEIGLKYSINKEGKVKLYVYEEKEAKKQIGQFIIIGTISLILLLAICF